MVLRTVVGVGIVNEFILLQRSIFRCTGMWLLERSDKSLIPFWYLSLLAVYRIYGWNGYFVHFFDVHIHCCSTNILVKCARRDAEGSTDVGNFAFIINVVLVWKRRAKCVVVLRPEIDIGVQHLGNFNFNFCVYTNGSQRRSNLWGFGRLGASQCVSVIYSFTLIWEPLLMICSLAAYHFVPNATFLMISEVALVALLAVYIFWLFMLLVLTYSKIVKLSSPFKFLFGVTAFLYGIVFTGLFAGYFYPLSSSAVVFLCFYAAINFYVWTLAFAFAPLGADEGWEFSTLFSVIYWYQWCHIVCLSLSSCFNSRVTWIRWFFFIFAYLHIVLLCD